MGYGVQRRMLVTVGTLALAVGQLFALDSQAGELAIQLTVVVGLGRDCCFLVCPPLIPSFISNGASCVLLSACRGPGKWQGTLLLIFMFV